MGNNRYILLSIIALAAFLSLAAGVIFNPSDMITKINTALKTKLSKEQQNSVKALISAFKEYGDGDARKLIYIIAVAWHESRLRPIKEIKAEPGNPIWDKYQHRYWNSGYYGRGFVQITWKDNYEKMGKLIGVDLVNNPDKALDPIYAAQIMVVGLMKGVFTGKKLSDYINGNTADFYNARRTVGNIMVNGKDTALMIQKDAVSIFNS